MIKGDVDIAIGRNEFCSRSQVATQLSNKSSVGRNIKTNQMSHRPSKLNGVFQSQGNRNLGLSVKQFMAYYI